MKRRRRPQANMRKMKNEKCRNAHERGKESIHVRYGLTHPHTPSATSIHVRATNEHRRTYWKWSHRSWSWCSFCTWNLHLLHFIIVVIIGGRLSVSLCERCLLFGMVHCNKVDTAASRSGFDVCVCDAQDDRMHDAVIKLLICKLRRNLLPFFSPFICLFLLEENAVTIQLTSSPGSTWHIYSSWRYWNGVCEFRRWAFALVLVPNRYAKKWRWTVCKQLGEFT